MTPKQIESRRKEISAQFKSMRQMSGLSIKEITNQTGLHRATINRIETGKLPWSIDSQILYENALKKK